eukprot:TRINITY_DN5019_c0_g1_i2.p1 TRINITY_DN5019_c0_g1~~TRINITY_DN5019_c0_g1_i2.p1  ORF type:complete len:277 (-),score=69.49 TRINITY_DN5019_c0_g1_i2:75-905(-)
MRLYIGGLGETVTEQDLRKLFSPYGNIFSIDIRRTNPNDASSPCKGFAFMNINTFEDIQNLIGSQFTFRGQHLTLDLAKEDYLFRWRKGKEREIEKEELERQQQEELKQEQEQEINELAANTKLIYWIERDPQKRRVRFTFRKPLDIDKLHYTYIESAPTPKKQKQIQQYQQKEQEQAHPVVEDSAETQNVMMGEQPEILVPSLSFTGATKDLFSGPTEFKLQFGDLVPDVPLPSETSNIQEQPKATKLIQKKDKREELLNIMYEGRGLFDVFLNM